MLVEKKRKQNAIVAACAVDLGLKTLMNLQGGQLGKIDAELMAQIISTELTNELINRRQHNAK